MRSILRTIRNMVTAVSFLLDASVVAAHGQPPRLVGYVTPQAQPSRIEAQRMSDAIFALAQVKGGRVTLDEKASSAFARLRDALRQRNPPLATAGDTHAWAIADHGAELAGVRALRLWQQTMPKLPAA